MFGLFGTKKNRFVGVDFGTSYIKIVELSYRDQKAHLENYGVVDLGMVIQNSDKSKMQSYEDRMIDCLKQTIAKMGLKTLDSFISIPGFSGLVTLVEFPEMKEEEIAKAIQFEAHKYIPSSLNEVAMSWEIIAKKNDAGDVISQEKVGPKKMQVLLVAAPKKEIAKYEHLVVGAGMSVSAIELETFSITRALIGDDGGNFMIIDIGSRATNIILVEKGVVRVNRNIDAGGNEITNTIAESLNISKQRAEILKKGDKDILNGKEAVVIPVIELIFGEALRILNVYGEKNKEIKIDGVFLSGGSAQMKGLDEYCNKSLGLKVSIGNPWRRIVYDEKLRKHIEDMGSSFSVAIGLALRGIDEYKRK